MPKWSLPPGSPYPSKTSRILQGRPRDLPSTSYLVLPNTAAARLLANLSLTPSRIQAKLLQRLDCLVVRVQKLRVSRCREECAKRACWRRGGRVRHGDCVTCRFACGREGGTVFNGPCGYEWGVRMGGGCVRDGPVDDDGGNKAMGGCGWSPQKTDLRYVQSTSVLHSARQPDR